MRPAVFLDRDGTLIVDTKYPRDPALVEALPGAIDACARLAQDFALVVVSNQSGVARGIISPAEAAAVDARFRELFPAFAGVYYCFHGPDDGCDCRKPLPGLLHRAIRDHDLSAAIMIGDKPSDVEAGLAAGCRKSIHFLDWPTALRSCYE